MELLTYLWKSALVLSIFFLFYQLLLKKETYFSTNRFFLISGIIGAFVLPLITIPIYKEVYDAPYSYMSDVTTTSTTTSPTFTFTYSHLILLVYISIVAILLFKFFIHLSSLFKLIQKNSQQKVDGYRIIETNKAISPFSFFNYIVYNPDQFSGDELTHILRHERTHALQKHSLDLLLAHLMVVIQWYNPVAWLYKKALEQNLEYIADDQAHISNQSLHSYQHLLVKTTVPQQQLVLVNNFYNSLLKKRILMLHSKRSNKQSQWKIALILPLLITFLGIFNTEVVAQPAKKEKKLVVKENEIFAQVFTNTSTDADLNKLVSTFKEKGLTVVFSEAKRNSEGILTAIKIDASLQNKKASASYACENEDGINPVLLSLDTKNNSINIGSAHDDINFKFNHNKEDDHAMVWVTKDGDTSKVKSKKFIVVKTNEENDDEETTFEIITDEDVVVKKEVTVVKSDDENKKMIFFSTDKHEPIYIIDGVKSSKKDMEKLDPDSIASINVYKGDSADKKYGKEGKNGVIVITTKK